jgi:KAP family P-loop domain
MSHASVIQRTALIDAIIKELQGSAHERNKACVHNIMLTGPWGCGKTTVLAQLLERLKSAKSQTVDAVLSNTHVIVLSVTDLTADGSPRAALIGLLQTAAKERLPYMASDRKISVKRIGKLLDAIAKPVGDVVSAFVPGGKLLGDAASFTAKMITTYCDDKPGAEYASAFAEMRKDMRWYLEEIAAHYGAQRILLVVDDLDRIKPEQAVALLDSVFHVLLRETELGSPNATDNNAKQWPMSSIWAANSAVLEEFFYAAYKNVPSFDPAAYLEKIFSCRFTVPPLFYLPTRKSATEESDAPAEVLWKPVLAAMDPALPSVWASTLAREVNYGSLGNLRVHQRVRAMCERLWTISIECRPKTASAAVEDARLLTLTAIFPEFCSHVAFYEGRWPGFINRLNERWEKPSVEVPTNPIYRHIDEPDLHTLLQDIGALKYIETAEELIKGTEIVRVTKAKFVLDDLRMRWLAGELVSISHYGF